MSLFLEENDANAYFFIYFMYLSDFFLAYKRWYFWSLKISNVKNKSLRRFGDIMRENELKKKKVILGDKDFKRVKISKL